MIRFLILRFLVPLLLFFFLRSFLRSLAAGFHSFSRPAANAGQSAPPVQAGGELKKDPVCGTYVSAITSLTRTVNGTVVHFCSPECRDKYRVA